MPAVSSEFFVGYSWATDLMPAAFMFLDEILPDSAIRWVPASAGMTDTTRGDA